MAYTVGTYLATRLSQIGLKHHFVVAGDYNLELLDQLLANKDLQQVYCCHISRRRPSERPVKPMTAGQ
jgi:pyruvate decarboxylase